MMAIFAAFIAGCWVGVVIMCMLQIGRREE